mmetsp:Transcript_13649/g.43103  ORF Transcript_13649/g.43103 Transcript_13649/m.43103 type:complete len:220 (+) Transcript_13649:1238-1897(+)
MRELNATVRGEMGSHLSSERAASSNVTRRNAETISSNCGRHATFIQVGRREYLLDVRPRPLPVITTLTLDIMERHGQKEVKYLEDFPFGRSSSTWGHVRRRRPHRLIDRLHRVEEVRDRRSFVPEIITQGRIPARIIAPVVRNAIRLLLPFDAICLFPVDPRRRPRSRPRRPPALPPPRPPLPAPRPPTTRRPRRRSQRGKEVLLRPQAPARPSEETGS